MSLLISELSVLDIQVKIDSLGVSTLFWGGCHILPFLASVLINVKLQSTERVTFAQLLGLLNGQRLTRRDTFITPRPKITQVSYRPFLIANLAKCTPVMSYA
jgi:hypothetical protein